MKVKRVIDLSQPFVERGFNNPAFDDGRVKICMQHETEGWHAETITFATHVGTHIDAPLHKIPKGASIDTYPLTRFVGNAVVVDLYHKKPDEEITLEDFKRRGVIMSSGDTILLCTGWSEKKKPKSRDEYLYHSPWLGKKAARYLVEKGVNAVGIDHFSIGGANPEHVEIPHDILLLADVLILEDLILPEVLLERSSWFISAFPLPIEGASGAPARIVVIEWAE